jgi:formate hydrogenlyase transcriptional activator
MAPQTDLPGNPAESQALWTIVRRIKGEVGEGFIRALVENMAQTLGVQYAVISERIPYAERVRTRALWGRGKFMDDIEFPFLGCPCEVVLRGEVIHVPDAVRTKYPDAPNLIEWKIESYCGVPLIGSDGSVIGHIGVMDDKPMPDGSRALALLQICAARTCAEIERMGAERALNSAKERFAKILASAMDAIVTFNARRRIVIFNEAAEKIFGCSAADAISTPLERFLTPDLCRSLEDTIARLDAGEFKGHYIWSPDGLNARRTDGTEFPIEATISNALTEDGWLYTLILRDVDEKRRAREEIEQLGLQNEYLQEEIKQTHHSDEIIGRSPLLHQVLDKVRLVAPTDSTVLILGETGTGKELIARAIHAGGPRRDKPLIKVNCAALPAGLIESELFGHERGAFTGATERRMGRFELADGGTIFLDEIGEMPPELQVKLLRVLQEHEFDRVGGRTPIKVNVRVITATNRDLEAEVAAGRYRQDLYYRLNVFPIELPALRERVEDIPLLVHYFVSRYAATIGRKIARVSEDAMQVLREYSWPGNVRELENVIERAVILSSGHELRVDDLALHPSGTNTTDSSTVLHELPVELHNAAASADGALSLTDIERRHILTVLERTSWRVDGPSGAARLLNLNPSTLRSRMKKLGIQRSFRDISRIREM